jgi:mono/diheme cytochrome c family protein
VNQRALTDRAFEPNPERPARGEHLAWGALQCVSCHSPLDTTAPGEPPVEGRAFSGRIFEEYESGRLIAPNLTPDPETGAGLWSDDALARAIREGVGHDGRGLGLPMYWQSFRALSDEDLASVIVYLRSLEPVRNVLPARRLTGQAEEARAAGARPLDGPVATRTFDEPWKLGQYLVELSDCVGCHTSWYSDPVPGLGGGGNHITDEDGLPVFSRNITPDPTGIGGWSKADFRWAMRTGKGGSLHPVMRWSAFARLTDEELDAIYDVLFLMDPVRHVVGNGMAPTRCETCGQMHGLGHVNAPLEPLTGHPLDRSRGEAYVGRYLHPGWGDTIGVGYVGDVLEADWNGEDAAPLHWQEGDVFRAYLGLPGTLRFVRGDGGRVVGLELADVGPQRFERLPAAPAGGG